MRSLPRLYDEDQLPVSRERERERESAGRQTVAVAEAGDSSGTQRKGNARLWKLLPSSAVKTVTEKTSLCVIVSCKIWSHVV
jgi:hypothetical protein